MWYSKKCKTFNELQVSFRQPHTHPNQLIKSFHLDETSRCVLVTLIIKRSFKLQLSVRLRWNLDQ